MIGKFNLKSDEGVSLSYSNNNMVYRVYNMRTQTIMKYANVMEDDFSDFSKFSKEEEITNLLDETVEISGADQIVETEYDNVATLVDTVLRENVTTFGD